MAYLTDLRMHLVNTPVEKDCQRCIANHSITMDLIALSKALATNGIQHPCLARLLAQVR